MTSAPWDRGGDRDGDVQMPWTIFDDLIGHEDGFTSETLGGDVSRTRSDLGLFMLIDPGGAARNYDLDFDEMCAFFAHNDADAAEALTIRDGGDNTIVTLNQGEGAILVCDGTANGWDALGPYSAG